MAKVVHTETCEAKGWDGDDIIDIVSDLSLSFGPDEKVVVISEEEYKRLTAERVQFFRWSYQLLLALAKRRLRDLQNDNGIWPGRQEWHHLAGTSQSIFLRLARAEAEVPHQEYLDVIRSGDIAVDDLYDNAITKSREQQEE